MKRIQFFDQNFDSVATIAADETSNNIQNLIVQAKSGSPYYNNSNNNIAGGKSNN